MIKSNIAYEDILGKMKMFRGISKDRIKPLVELLEGEIKDFKTKEVIVKASSSTKAFGVVLKGIVEAKSVTRDDEIIQRFSSGNSFLEALAFGNSKSFVDVICSSDATILFISSQKILENKDNPDVVILMMNLLKEFSSKLSLMSFKNQLLSETHIRSRLLMYLGSLDTKKDGYKKVPFLQKDLAQYLNVNKSAFNRELARMKSEGIIEVRGKEIKILKDIDDEKTWN